MASLEETRDWPHAVVLKLFELVKPEPVLYDPTHESWSNTILKGRIWTTIAKELDPHLSSKKCRDRFQYNKKRYANEIRKQIASGDVSGVNLDLMWLVNQHENDEEKENHHHLNGSKMVEGNKSESPTNEQENHDPESGIHSHESDEEAATAASTTNPISGSTLMDIFNQIPAETDSADEERPLKRRKRKNSIPQKFEVSQNGMHNFNQSEPHEIAQVSSHNNNAFIELLSTFKSLHDQQQQKQIEQECSIFGRQVEIDLRRLTHQNRAKARLAITSILSDLYQQQF
uniref:MADF domain-containing protein n=1 Tax=Panagrolaimus superbus TaxID=310955 RepID=A0A914Y8A2_9BILA